MSINKLGSTKYPNEIFSIKNYIVSIIYIIFSLQILIKPLNLFFSTSYVTLHKLRNFKWPKIAARIAFCFKHFPTPNIYN